MSNKIRLRADHVAMVLNAKSKKQESQLDMAIRCVQTSVTANSWFHGIKLYHQKQWHIGDVIKRLQAEFPNIDFKYYHKDSSMRPDGGILSILTKDEKTSYPILIAEKKNQGTNDLRASEGKKKQAKGNAIERLGKNVIGFRAALLSQGIFPFVCFGDGCDFADNSSILDRVVTIAMFGELNKEYVHNIGVNGVFNRGTFYFREKEWTKDEMAEKCRSIAERSIFYYFSKYGKEQFV
jgi:type II restriction enzyme